jgi:hypothetical protein
VVDVMEVMACESLASSTDVRGVVAVERDILNVRCVDDCSGKVKDIVMFGRCG